MMFRVLQNWREIGEAIVALQRRRLPLHETPQKNWDHYRMVQLLETAPRDWPIADLGCGNGFALEVLRALTFHSLYGVDFRLSARLRMKQALCMLREHSFRPPYRLLRGNLLKTPLRSAAYRFLISISTIEHAVDLKQFFDEAFRLLVWQGILYVTTDYWEDKLDTDGIEVYGLPWRIFSRPEIMELIDLARQSGLEPVGPAAIPKCGEACISWQNRDYTFLAMSFVKRGPVPG